MSRDDSMLYTGATSASFTSATGRQLQAKKQQGKDERDARRAELKPASEAVLATVDKEIETTKLRLLAMVGPGTPDEDVKNLLIALNLYGESLGSLRKKLQVILKESV